MYQTFRGPSCTKHVGGQVVPCRSEGVKERDSRILGTNGSTLWLAVRSLGYSVQSWYTCSSLRSSLTLKGECSFASSLAQWQCWHLAIQVNASGISNKYVQESFNTMRFIVAVGWSIYPLGYFFGYLQGSVDDDTLNLIYNLADFVNKIAFCLAIWASAKNST